jgi:hypothetical protein
MKPSTVRRSQNCMCRFNPSFDNKKRREHHLSPFLSQVRYFPTLVL